MSNEAANRRKTAPKTVFEEIRTFTGKLLGGIFTNILRKSEESFLKISEAIKDPEERNHLQDVLLELKNNREKILLVIRAEFTDVINGTHQQLHTQNKDPELTLSLVGDEELEETIIISDVSNKVDATYDQAIKAIRRGIVRLSKQLDFEPEPDALTPTQFARLLQSALSKYKLRLTDKSIIYNTFRDVATELFKPLYTGILTLLEENSFIESKENPLSSDYEIINQFRRSVNRTAIAPNNDSETTPVISTENISDEAIASILESHKLSAGMAPVIQQPVAAHDISQAIFQDNALSRLLYDYLSQSKQRTGDPGTPVDSDQLVSMLSNMQVTSGSDEDVIANAKALTSLIDEQLQKDISEDAELSSIEGNVIDLINKLFVAILDDPDLPDPVKVQMSRLQIPYIKVAILDISLLKEEAHPARLLLNEISMLGVRVSDLYSPALDKIRIITQSIIDNFESDLNIFTQLLVDIRAFIKEQTDVASATEQKTVGKAENQAKILYIKKMVIQQLRKFLQGKKLTRELYPIVLKGFAPYFLKIYRTTGEDSDEWRDGVDMFRQIIESTQNRDSLAQLAIIVERTPDILKKTRDMLSILPHKEGAEEPTECLEKFYQKIEQEYLEQKRIAEAENKPIEIDDAEDPFDYGDDEGDITLEAEIKSQPSPLEIIAKLPGDVKIGTWFEIYMGRNTQAQRLKVSSIIMDTAQIVFVDVSGSEPLVKDITELLDELDCERSKILKDYNLFDKALAAVVTNLQFAKEAEAV